MESAPMTAFPSTWSLIVPTCLSVVPDGLDAVADGPDAVRSGSPLGAVTLRPGRVDTASVEAALAACGGAAAEPGVFVCGPTSFVEALVDLLAGAGLDPRTIRAERFG